MAAHSKIGASSSYRWLECPGSVPLSEQAPEQQSSVYAEEGTAAHELAEKCLKSGKDADDFIGAELNGFEVDAEMADHVQVYLDVVRADYRKYPDYKGVETRIHLSWIDDNAFGTSDSHAGKKNKRLVVHDYKHGAGIPVDAEENTQGLYYVLGVAEKYGFEFEEYEFCIVQPRAFHPAGPVRRWVFSKERLKQYENDLLKGIQRVEKARLSDDLSQHLNPGDHCRFCPAAIICPVLKRKMEMTVGDDFDDVAGVEIVSITPTPPNELSPEKLAAALQFASIMESWISQIRSFAYQEAQIGNPPPGYKLVQKYGRRKWKNEHKAEQILTLYGLMPDEIHVPPKMKSPAQIEKLFKKARGLDKKFVERLTLTPESGSALVPIGDRREAVSHSVGDDFDAIIDEENV